MSGGLIFLGIKMTKEEIKKYSNDYVNKLRGGDYTQDEISLAKYKLEIARKEYDKELKRKAKEEVLGETELTSQLVKVLFEKE